MRLPRSRARLCGTLIGMRITLFGALTLVGALAAPLFAKELPPGYWPPERTPEILDLTRTIRLAPALGDLTLGERRAVRELIEAGKLMQRMYENAFHPDALSAYDTLVQMSSDPEDPPPTQALLDLYRLFKGPIATTPDNRREAFLPVRPETPNRNIYPLDANRSEIEAFIERAPQERAALFDARTVVRRATQDNIKADLDTLRRYPAIDVLHPGLRRKLESLRAADDTTQLYALPYSVRWAPEIMRVYARLNNAAAYVEDSDAEFARYLRNRARDLLSDDYESGDASWITGEFRRLNAQIGAYETYDDALFGNKAFMSLSLLKRDEAATQVVRGAVRRLQAIENALPAPQRRTVRDDLPIGVYDVIADFGQARGRNTATVLPNDPLLSKRYGRIILLRANILRNPDLMANKQAPWRALTTAPYRGDLTVDGEFNRTLWHEIGHYLGVDRDRRGRPLPVALQDLADTFEELKADLVALFAARHLPLSELQRVHVYASGVNRTLLPAKPRREQAYQTMQLMQFNWLYDKGVIVMEPVTGGMTIQYDRYHDAVSEMLEAVLKIQYEGDREQAQAFIEQWSDWTPDLHEGVAKTIRDNRLFEYALMTYAELGE